jgi:hypothetical protein
MPSADGMVKMEEPPTNGQSADGGPIDGGDVKPAAPMKKREQKGHAKEQHPDEPKCKMAKSK